jgi:glutamate---cysteine ligase / carboxylate-amine ligase
MLLPVSSRQFGVEEEFLLVDPATGEARAMAGAVMQAAAADGGQEEADPEYLEFELQSQQLEINTKPCTSLGELGQEVRRCRSAAARAAAKAGVRLAALATSPAPAEPTITGTSRYHTLAREFGLTAWEQLTCGCHVHVEISGPDEGVAVIDRVQPWLPVLLALSANSPYWQGRDSSYASFRYQVWGRWPSSGPTAWFGSARAYADAVQAMVDTSTVLDTGMVYFNARLSEHYPTVEVRIADVCLFPDDTILIAALTRALVETEARAWRDDPDGHPVRPELLRLAAWRASRSGIEKTLIDPVTGRPEPARKVIAALVDHVRPALDQAGDSPVVDGLLESVLTRGNGAMVQRESYGQAASVQAASVLAVVTEVVRRTDPDRPGG